MILIMLRYVPSTPTLLNLFIINRCSTLLNSFSASIYMMMWFLSFLLFMWCITFIYFWILYQPCIPGMNPTWSWCMILASPRHSDQTRKRNKRHPNWKGGSKTVIVCTWHDSVHRKSYRLRQKTTQANKWIWQTAIFKLNIQKSKAFLYTKNEMSQTDIRKKYDLI